MSWVWLAWAMAQCRPLYLHLSLTWNMCYIFVTSLLHSTPLYYSVRGSDRIISQDVITSSSKQNECSSEEWFENTVLMYNSNDCDYHQQKLWLSSVHWVILYSKIFFSPLLILSWLMRNDQMSVHNFCWRQLGSEETQEEEEWASRGDIPHPLSFKLAIFLPTNLNSHS